MYDLDKEIEEYSEELFVDLGPVALPEDKKADVYARVQQHLHQVILGALGRLLPGAEMAAIAEALEHEDYRALAKILKRHPQYKNLLEEKIEAEFKNLKLIIAEEQKNAAAGTTERAGA